jgi:hypothetical protein
VNALGDEGVFGFGEKGGAAVAAGFHFVWKVDEDEVAYEGQNTG